MSRANHGGTAARQYDDADGNVTNEQVLQINPFRGRWPLRKQDICAIASTGIATPVRRQMQQEMRPRFQTRKDRIGVARWSNERSNVKQFADGNAFCRCERK